MYYKIMHYKIIHYKIILRKNNIKNVVVLFGSSVR